MIFHPVRRTLYTPYSMRSSRNVHVLPQPGSCYVKLEGLRKNWLKIRGVLACCRGEGRGCTIPVVFLPAWCHADGQRETIVVATQPFLVFSSRYTLSVVTFVSEGRVLFFYTTDWGASENKDEGANVSGSRKRSSLLITPWHWNDMEKKASSKKNFFPGHTLGLISIAMLQIKLLPGVSFFFGNVSRRFYNWR